MERRRHWYVANYGAASELDVQRALGLGCHLRRLFQRVMTEKVANFDYGLHHAVYLQVFLVENFDIYCWQRVEVSAGLNFGFDCDCSQWQV
jgi:hypothetical protein